MPIQNRESEQRVTPVSVELRSADAAAPRIGGYALRFGKLSRNLGGFVERVAPGAVSKSVSDRLDVLCRFQHRDEFLLGRVSTDTLRLNVDGQGLDYDVDLPDTSVGRDVAALARRGDLSASSFAFQTLDDEWGLSDQQFPLRTLNAVKLIDVAPVVQPAYPDATSGLRSLAEARSLSFDEVCDLAEKDKLGRLFGPNPVRSVVDLAGRKAPPFAKPDDDEDDEDDDDKTKKPGKPEDDEKPVKRDLNELRLALQARKRPLPED